MRPTSTCAGRTRKGHLPGFDGAAGWLNSPPLTAAELRGRVVLVNFWPYTCINWLRTLPYVRAWSEKYQDQGLVVIGVHTPEFEFEHDLDNVRREVRDLRVDYPVAIDNDYAIWTAFDNHYWPALYFVDAQGQIRHHHFGEGEYQQSEMVIQQLLTEAGSAGAGHELVSVHARGVEAPADWDSLWSPENYLGYERTDNFVSPNGSILDTSYAYAAPTRLGLNHWALAGDWTVKQQAIVSNQAEGRIAYRFQARDLHLVVAPATPGGPIRFRVHLDGQPPGAAHGSDVDDQGNGTLTEPRLYSSCASPARSPSAPSRSPSWTPASRPTPSPSARPWTACPDRGRVALPVAAGGRHRRRPMEGAGTAVGTVPGSQRAERSGRARLCHLPDWLDRGATARDRTWTSFRLWNERLPRARRTDDRPISPGGFQTGRPADPLPNPASRPLP